MDANKANLRVWATILVPLACLVLPAGSPVPTPATRIPFAGIDMEARRDLGIRPAHQFDKTYVAAAFDYRGGATTMNFILVDADMLAF